MEETTRCPVCSGTTLKTMTKRTYRRSAASSDSYAARRLGFLFDRLVPDSDTVSFTVVLCRGCGLLFSNPRLNPEEMAAKYGYLADLLDDSERAAEPTLRAEERSIRIYRGVSRSMGGPPVGLRVLDYGGAQGTTCCPSSVTTGASWRITWSMSRLLESSTWARTSMTWTQGRRST